MNFHVITTFPNLFESYLGDSILARAIGEKKIEVSFYNPRNFADDKWHRTDERPYGGGPGMVMSAEPILRAAQAIKAKLKTKNYQLKTFILSPAGEQFTNAMAGKMAKRKEDVILICGRYEGVDARVKKILGAKEISVGPYVLTGGELPAMIIVDAIARQLPGVLGKDESVEERRVSSSEVYTRPEILEWHDKKYRVPKVLLSGDHKKIEEWKNSTFVKKD